MSPSNIADSVAALVAENAMLNAAFKDAKNQLKASQSSPALEAENAAMKDRLDKIRSLLPKENVSPLETRPAFTPLANETEETNGNTHHTQHACESIVSTYVRWRQLLDPNFFGPVDGQFSHKEVMAFLDDCHERGEWTKTEGDSVYTAKDEKKQHLADRLSAAICALGKKGLIERNCLGGHTIAPKNLFR